MTERNRAWRRKQAWLAMNQVEMTTDLLNGVRQVAEQSPKGHDFKAIKPHQHGKLTQAQSLRQSYALLQEASEGF